MLAGPRRLLKELFSDGKGTLSLTRLMMAVVAINAFTIVWLCVIWVHHVTVTNQMEAAAPLASAVFTGVAAILSAQVTMAAAQYFVQNKFGSGGISGRQLDIEDERASVLADEAAGVEHVPIVVPDVAHLVPSDPDEPRVAAESQSSEPSTVTVTADAPIPVELTEGDTDARDEYSNTPK